MKILMIGGTGRISKAVSEEISNRGHELYVLNRGHNNEVLPKDVKTFTLDIFDEDAVNKALEGYTFDVVVEWFAFTPEHIERDIRLFKGITKQYVFISTASAYQKPLPKLPITEDIPLDNPYWEYSKNKQLCEERLLEAKDDTFNVTIVRPSHTYDETSLVFQLKPGDQFTLVKRMLERKPIVIPDEGTTQWTLTYNHDLASGFTDLLGNEKAYNDIFHLTSDKVYTWNEIVQSFYDALDIEPNIVHIPTDFILKYFPEFEGELLGDKNHDALFDNSKVKSVAPNYKSETEYPDIAKKVIAHFLENPELQTVDKKFEQRYDTLIRDFKNKE
jgi:nucleoside-diphosphate-sugar epimerase